jgi:predicted ArsR family transcriptional regulator
MEAVELVLKTLQTSEKPMSAGEIAKAVELDKKEVDKAMKALKAEGRIESPKRCFWTAV